MAKAKRTCAFTPDDIRQMLPVITKDGAFTRSDLILLYTVVTSRIAMLALNPDLPEDAAYRQSLVHLSLRIENMVYDMDTPRGAA